MKLNGIQVFGITQALISANSKKGQARSFLRVNKDRFAPLYKEVVGWVADFEDEYDITRLRDAVIPSGLDLWWFCVAYKHGVMAGHSSRPALLCYMRARSGKEWREMQPMPMPVSAPPRADGSMVCMYFRHGPTRDEVALRQQQRTHGTRSKAPMCPGVTLKLKVEPWQVKMMGMRGWDKCSESSV